MPRVGRGEAAIQAYIDAFTERRSYEPQPGEEEQQSPERERLLLRAWHREKLCYAALNGGQLGEARRRIAAVNTKTEDTNNG